MKTFTASLGTILLAVSISGALAGTDAKGKAKKRETVCVPDEQTAIKVAEAVLESVYGKKVLEEKPYKVHSTSGYWTIEGTLRKEQGQALIHGGVFHIEINKVDAKVLYVTHGK